jgi:hypothetical protein
VAIITIALDLARMTRLPDLILNEIRSLVTALEACAPESRTSTHRQAARMTPVPAVRWTTTPRRPDLAPIR